MVDIDREYEYGPKGWILLFCAVFFSVGAVVVGSAAASGTYTGWLVLFFWVLCALSIVEVALLVAQAVARLLLRQRVAFTPTSLLLPKSRWTSEEVVINYGAITGLFVSSADFAPRMFRVAIDCQTTTELAARKGPRWRFLYLSHTGGERCIAAGWLPSQSAFDEVCELLMARVRLSQQVSRTETGAAPDDGG